MPPNQTIVGIIITTTTTSEAESTTTTAVAAPTFKIVGGGSAVNGALLEGLDSEGSAMMFKPNILLTITSPERRPSSPARAELKIKTLDTIWCMDTLAPTRQPIPQTVCTMGFFNPISPPSCETSTSNEVYDHLYYQVFSDQYIYFGRDIADNTYAAVDLIAQEA
ncbi:hypothetical protein Forpe1208_v005644 [Fusarium oxysporum f. sp. rapae]|uniref:Uncharacterized protein n=1 Tax=Fusarium oxysporum f. sp. rapae TaxID=485398 RepID=A0A8J5P9M8_FUSOX|nr:hypothetical protein Forpe1208_v005644 [Fusarium oxysporum f. sp. rapae]